MKTRSVCKGRGMLVSAAYLPFIIVVVSQKVNARPSASFSAPGKVYSLCQGGPEVSPDDAETVPLTFSGRPPFSVDLEIRPQGSKLSRPQHLPVANIQSTSFNVKIPHHLLSSGVSHVTIRRVKDGAGCERLIDPLTAPSVQIAVHERPVAAQ